MKENKNIDRLFQEKFKNLDVNPTEQVWENIELRLRKKKNKKVIPFWWKLSGIAAAFVIGLGIYNFATNDNPIVNDVVIENDDVNSTKRIDLDKININDIDANEVVSNKNNDVEDATTAAGKNNTIGKSVINKVSKNNSGVNTISKSNDAVADKSDKNKSSKNNSDATKFIKNNDAVADKSDKNKSSKNNAVLNTISKTNDAVAVKSDKNKSSKNNTDANKFIKNNDAVADKSNDNKASKNNADANQFTKNNDAVADKLDKNKSSKNDADRNNSFIKNNNAIADKLDNKKANENNFDKNININKSINNNSVIVENQNSDLKKNDTKKLDSAQVASVELNAMEELLNEKEKKTSKEPKLNRWQLSSNVAPIYFSSTSNGSPLDSELKNNSKQYSTNFSYGVGVNYAINKKIKIRTGINALAIDYNTNDVVFFQNTNAQTLQNVKTNAMGDVIQIETKSKAAENLELATNGLEVNKFNSAINQKIGYIEVPFEMSYNVLNKKIGVDVIGGVSTLFLNQNEVSVMSSGTQIMIGEANNLNDVHFSTNVGLGFRYGFFKRFEARIEPVFKYQINTFNTNAGDFKPYFFGLYSGVTFTF